MMFEYSKILIDKYTRKTKQIFLMDTYLSGIKYIIPLPASNAYCIYVLLFVDNVVKKCGYI